MAKKKNPEKKKLDVVEIAKKKRHLALLGKVQDGKALTASEMRELERFNKDPLPAGQVETLGHVAKAFGVSQRTVHRWVSEGMPRAEEGGYDIVEIQAWRSMRGAQHKDDGEDEKTQWDIKYRQMKALLAEIEYKKRIGDLIPKEEVEAGMIYEITAIKMQFLSLPQRLAPQLEGLDVGARAALINDRIQEIIKGFADGQY